MEEKQITYEEFKRLADRAIKHNDPVYRIEAMKSGAIVNDKLVLREEDAIGFKNVLDSCICLTAIAKDNAFKFYDLLASTGSEELRAKRGLKEKFCEDGKARSMNQRLLKLCKQHDKHLMDFGRTGDYEDILMMCDSIDRAEEMLDPITDAYKRYMMHKITRKTLSTPLDPVLLNQMIVTFELISICEALYNMMVNNYPIVAKYQPLKFLNMSGMLEQMIKLQVKLDFHDINMKPLLLNINSLMRTKEAIAIGDDIISLFMSYDFQQEIILVSNPDLIVEHKPHISLLPMLDKITLTIDEYKQKYEPMYRYEDAV